MTVIVIVLFVLTALGALYSLLSLGCVLGFFKGPDPFAGRSPGDREFPPVSILKAVKGLDPAGAENLSSFCAQDYPCYEVLIGFREADDVAIPFARVIASRAHCDARLVVSGEGSGSNQKVLNLIALAHESRYPFLALSDSDMKADPDYLQRIMTEFQGGRKTGMVTSLYKISNPRSMGAALESLSIALDFVPSVLVARRLEGVTFGLGASILMTREALRDIGGFESIKEYLADDYQLGFKLWKKGYRNVISRYVIENRVGPMSLAGHLNHRLRWARTYKASRPWGFLGYGITHMLTFALILFCLSPSPASALALALALGLRCTLALVMYRKVIRTRRWLASLPFLPLCDILGFFVWLWSFAGSRVVWRGVAFRVDREGKMVRV